ncbi:hypothetical protein [Nocardiopsis sp. CNT-189]|uniref:hypothetical protein n=1 Tax=Nocardiopsis oceanisediminis TaxID=2816862 RepID=UPI003B3B0AB5
MAGTGAFSASGRFSPVRAAAGAAARAELAPAAITRVGAVLGVLAALWFSSGDLRGAVAGSVLLGAVLFCGEVRDALAGPSPDAFTEWLDVVLGRLREYAVYAGLAVGGVLAGVEDAWAWAAGALIAGALRDTAIASGAPGAAAPRQPAPRGRDWSSAVLGGLDPERPPGDPGLTRELLGDPVPERDRPPRRRSGSYALTARPGPLSGLRAAACFPEPVRFLVIAVTAVFADARVTFIALITGCAIAATAALVDPRPGEGRR